MPDAVVSLVSRLYAAGFPIGPEPDEPCRRCGHVWGNHLLYALVDPTDGGTWSCPHASGCTCFGTWSVPEKVRAVIERYREQKREQG